MRFPVLAGLVASALISVSASAQNTSSDRSGRAAASGDNNQAVATTNQNATEPARGSNSFTMGQAQSRLENQGYTNVTALQKDANGVWRGTAQKDGRTQQVWVDYKGNVGAGTEHASQTR